VQKFNFIFDNQLLNFFESTSLLEKIENCIQYPCNLNNNGQ
jgi:hypothetical protein